MENSDVTQGFKPREWYAVGAFFVGPFCFDNPGSGDPPAEKFGVSLSVQSLGVMDVGSGRMLTAQPIPKLPGYFTADEICGFLRQVFTQHGKPKIGVLISHSVWQSSHELLLSDETKPRGEWLQKMEIEIPPMPLSEKRAIRERVEAMGLVVSFDDDPK